MITGRFKADMAIIWHRLSQAFLNLREWLLFYSIKLLELIEGWHFSNGLILLSRKEYFLAILIVIKWILDSIYNKMRCFIASTWRIITQIVFGEILKRTLVGGFAFFVRFVKSWVLRFSERLSASFRLNGLSDFIFLIVFGHPGALPAYLRPVLVPFLMLNQSRSLSPGPWPSRVAAFPGARPSYFLLSEFDLLFFHLKDLQLKDLLVLFYLE